MSLDGTLDATVTDGAVRLTFAVSAGENPVELHFPDACEAEFVVSTDGREVWRYTEGRMFAQVLRTDRLGPGETATYEVECDPLDDGRYVATASLRARTRDCEARTEFAV